MMNEEVKAESFTLKKEDGQWLGQVVLTSDGMFAAVTDYGNYSFAWRSFGNDFKAFILSLNPSYFGGKMYLGQSDICFGKKYEQAAYRFAEKILPALQYEIKSRLGFHITNLNL
jgi:hypothetical protein